MKKSIRICLFGVMTFFGHSQSVWTQTVSTFESLLMEPDTFWNGSDMPLGTTFQDANGIFPNVYELDFGGYWSTGWAYSSMRDSFTPGFENLYSAITATGVHQSSTYAVGVFNPVIRLDAQAIGKVPGGFYITNSTYAALSMKEGDFFAKKFGGETGDDPDWFKITVRSYAQGVLTPDSVEFYLADFRFEDNGLDYILKSWEWVDLTSLGNSDSLQIFMSSSDTGDFGMNTPAYFCIDDFTTADYELFAPPVGVAGTTAIHKDSSVFKAWATGAEVTRGLQDRSDPDLGFANVGESAFALGQAGSNGLVSLGDGGSAILTFDHPVINGEGWDFAVFENSFSDSFLEIAFVEVSSDGVQFYRFPATSYTQTASQVEPEGTIDARLINNLAGKYRALYGTPFDLEELADQPGLDIDHVTHIKVIDVVGSIDPAYATYDQFGNIVNDPWPTPYPSSGFDLDAVGVIHTEITATEKHTASTPFIAYPNPAQGNVYLNVMHSAIERPLNVTLSDCTGSSLQASWNVIDASMIELDLEGISTGVYFVTVHFSDAIFSTKILIQK